MSPPESSASEGSETTDNKPSVESLGEALAGVNIGNSTGLAGSSGISADPFAITPGNNKDNNDAWGNFSPTEESAMRVWTSFFQRVLLKRWVKTCSNSVIRTYPRSLSRKNKTMPFECPSNHRSRLSRSALRRTIAVKQIPRRAR